jgi:hypothetical protein
MKLCLNCNNVEVLEVPLLTGFLYLLDRELPDNIEEI